jgi:hypothetical protein
LCQQNIFKTCKFNESLVNEVQEGAAIWTQEPNDARKNILHVAEVPMQVRIQVKRRVPVIGMVGYKNTCACFVGVIRDNGGGAIPGRVVDSSYNRGVIFENCTGSDAAGRISANISK